MQEDMFKQDEQDEEEEACCITCGYPVSQCACGEQSTCPVCHKAYVFCTCSDNPKY